MSIKLKPLQLRALELLSIRGSMLITEIPDKTERSEWDGDSPGIKTYDELEKLEFIIITEEEPFLFDGEEEPFTFTPQVEITAEGRKILKENS